jgi:hypothetical protein
LDSLSDSWGPIVVANATLVTVGYNPSSGWCFEAFLIFHHPATEMMVTTFTYFPKMGVAQPTS